MFVELVKMGELGRLSRKQRERKEKNGAFLDNLEATVLRLT